MTCQNDNKEAEKEWDHKMDEHVKNLKKGKQLFIECFLGEIEAHKYNSVSLIVDSLNVHLAGLNKELRNEVTKV